MTGKLLARAWAAGAGPGGEVLMLDFDSTICEVHGYHKQGAAYGYTRRLGYHPLLATRAETGEVLHVRQRKGSAASARGCVRFPDETVARARRAGSSGELRLRADSAFWSERFVKACRRHRIGYSITVPSNSAVRLPAPRSPRNRG
ncbi:MAG TPA: transposase [Actinomycetota bacterium]|nr:transposase [Actinomycetota bacterium]